MFANLIKLLCGFKSVSLSQMGSALGYKTASAFQTVTTGKDLRLSVLLNICNELGYTVTISNGQGVNVNLTEYYAQQTSNANGEK